MFCYIFSDNAAFGKFPDDLSHLLDVESNLQLPTDDLINGLPDDLEVRYKRKMVK